jgi:sugar phosphate permease
MVKKSFFYGWIIVGVVFVGMVFVYGIRHSFSIFFPSILGEFGWARGSTAIMLSLNILVYGLLAPVAGSLADRWHPRRVTMIGLLVLGLATAGCALARELWHFYLLFGVLMPMGMALCGWPILCPTLANWFTHRRGLAIALGQMGSGLSFTYGFFVEFVISEVGWRYAFIVIATILVVILLPVYFLFFHYRPESKGLEPYCVIKAPAVPEKKEAAVLAKKSLSRGWTLGSAMRTYQLWLIALAYMLFWGIGCYLALAHQVKFAEDVGYSSTFAASIFALFGIFNTAGMFSSSISDWIGREMTVFLAAVLVIGGMMALVLVRDTSAPWLLYSYAICFGIGAGLFSPAVNAGAADIFHGRDFGAIAGFLQTGMGIGGAIGPWLGGFIYDISGSYFGAFIFCMVCFGLAFLAFFFAAPRKAAGIRRKP